MGLSSKKVVISSDGLDWTQNLLQSHHHHQAILDHQLPKQQPLIRRQQNQQNQSEPLKCPRCDSSNTKFCYYNNYNKSQPRHFCKSCKRHWTKGGTLRNVPVGGGRKNKRHKSSSKTTTTIAAEAAARTSTNHNVSIINRVNSHLPLPLGGQKNLSEILYRAGLISPTSASASSSSAFQQNSISNNSNGVIFGSNLSLPQTQDQGLSFPFPNPFQSSEFCEYTGEPLENSTITTTSSTITLPWQAPNTNFWNWDDIDNLVSTADLNIPWNDDDPEIKP